MAPTEQVPADHEVDDEPSVIGAGCGRHPMPTQEDYRRAHKAEYVRLFVEAGVPEETAAGWHDEDWEKIKDGTPQQAYDDQVQYWENDGD